MENIDYGVPWVSSGTTGKFCFCKKKGRNLVMNKTKTVARRFTGFADAVCFSRSALLPWQLFLVEIVDSQKGWSGHLRIGVTAHVPHSMKLVPEMVMPDFAEAGGVWAVAITNYHNRVFNEHKEITSNTEQSEHGDTVRFANQKISLKDLYFRGQKKFTFSKEGIRLPDFGQATYDGSRIGIMIVPISSKGEEVSTPNLHQKNYFKKCNLHLIINGEDMGAPIKNLPLERPLYVVTDVYSKTTGIEIIQLKSLPSLKDLARNVITSKIKEPDVIKTLPLPNRLIEFCLYL